MRHGYRSTCDTASNTDEEDQRTSYESITLSIFTTATPFEEWPVTMRRIPVGGTIGVSADISDWVWLW